MSAPANTATSSSGMLIGGVIVVLVLLGFAWYMMKEDGEDIAVPAPTTTTGTTPAETPETQAQAEEVKAEAAATALATQGSSDDMSAIDADLQATDHSSLNDADKL